MTQDLRKPEELNPKKDIKAIQREKKIKLRDKIVFFLGFVNLIAMVAIVFGKPMLYPYWHSFFTLVLLVHRYFEFKQKKWHYYLFDFCYFVSLLVIIYILAFPKSLNTYIAAFLLASGPIYLSIPVYRLAFVFHNSEKLTSFLVHSSPALTLWILRWYDQSGEFIGTEVLNGISFDLDFVLGLYKTSFSYYMGWAAIYYLVIFILRKNAIEKYGYETLYKYTMRGNETGCVLSLRTFGEKWAPAVYIFDHIVWVFSVLFLAQIVFFNYYAGLTLMVVFHLQGIWNAGTYYIDYFSRAYMQQFKSE